MEGDAEQNNKYHYNKNKGWGNAASDEYGILTSLVSEFITFVKILGYIVCKRRSQTNL